MLFYKMMYAIMKTVSDFDAVLFYKMMYAIMKIVGVTLMHAVL